MMSDEEDRPRASFTAFDEGTQTDYAILGAEFVRYASALPDRVLEHLMLLGHGHAGFPVDRLTHSLQAATLAYDDGRDEEYVVCALLHDIGDTLGSYNHPDIAAAILRPFVLPENHWMVEKHGIFQGYTSSTTSAWIATCARRSATPALRAHREFCAQYDAPAFDPRARPCRCPSSSRWSAACS
jgi:predicted HD phosphohydrolase